jgi:hypothetical protein
VEFRHDEGVDGEEGEVVFVEDRFQAGRGGGIGVKFGEEIFGETQFDGESFAGKGGGFEAEDVGFQTGPEFGECPVGEDV